MSSTFTNDCARFSIVTAIIISSI